MLIYYLKFTLWLSLFFSKLFFNFSCGMRGVVFSHRIPDFRRRIRVERRGMEQSLIQPEGWPQKLLLQLHSLDMLR